MNNIVICVIQARMNSSRFPAKVVAPIIEIPMLYYVIKRVSLSKFKKIVVATTKMPVDDIIEFVSENCNVDCMRGEESDVLARYVQAANNYNANAVVRITADCPLIDSELIGQVLRFYEQNPTIDYISIDGYPRGLGDVELVASSALNLIYKQTDKTQIYYREHVTTYITENPNKFNLCITKAPEKMRKPYRLCVDEIADLQVVRKVYEHFLPRIDFNSKEIVEFLDNNPAVARINQNVKQK